MLNTRIFLHLIILLCIGACNSTNTREQTDVASDTSEISPEIDSSIHDTDILDYLYIRRE